MRRAAALLIAAVCGLAVTGCSTDAPRNSAGQVTATASVDPFKIVVGDCTGPMKDGDIESLQVVPCADPHYFEAYAATNLTGNSFPGEAEVSKQATKFCSAEFHTFIGVATKDSSYDMYYLYPLEESWAAADRQVLCLAGTAKGGVQGSLKGVGK